MACPLSRGSASDKVQCVNDEMGGQKLSGCLEQTVKIFAKVVFSRKLYKTLGMLAVQFFTYVVSPNSRIGLLEVEERVGRKVGEEEFIYFTLKISQCVD